jgi:hypothetical protein
VGSDGIQAASSLQEAEMLHGKHPLQGSKHLGVLVLAALVGCGPDGGAARTSSTVEPPRTVDASYRPVIPEPAFQANQGPVVCVDETHNNFHTSVGTYAPFTDALRTDGYRVRRFTERGSEALAGCGVLVIADAQPPARSGDPPTFPSVEVEEINRWVKGGGALFLITDHMPDPGAVQDLASSFGIELHDGYVFLGSPEEASGAILFREEDGTLSTDPLFRGMGPDDEVTQVATFLGAALRGPEAFRSLLTLGPGARSWAPRQYYRFQNDTPVVDVSGWSQGGVLEFGSGRLAVFGEAAMFTAQIFDDGRVKAGMNAPEARDNLRLLLNVMRWLGRIGDDRSR